MWAVTWERDGVRYLIDIDTVAEAQRLAVAIAESGRAAVCITRVDLDIDPEVEARVKQRVAERLLAAGVLDGDA